MNSFHQFGNHEVAINAIVSMRHFKRGETDWAYKVTLADGQEFVADSSDVALLRERPTQIMPAASGTMVCHFASEGEAIYRREVIAWALCMDGEVRPVTPAGINDCEDASAPVVVELPNGSCHERWYDGSRCESVDEYARERRDAIAAREASKQRAQEASGRGGCHDR